MIRAVVRNKAVSTESEPIVHLWLLHILVALDGQASLANRYEFDDQALAARIGLGRWVDSSAPRFNRRKVRTDLRAPHRRAKQEKRSAMVALIFCAET